MNPTMNVIDIVVGDIDAAISFYGKLGIEFKVDPKYPEHASCDLPNRLHLMLDTESFRPAPTPLAGPARPVTRGRSARSIPHPGRSRRQAAELTGAGYRSVHEP